MIDLQKLATFSQQYRADEFPFLTELNQRCREQKPLAGVRILHNIPLTISTVLKLESLYLAGAEITVTHTQIPGLEPDISCIQLLNEINADVVIDHHQLNGQYDIAVDCCGQIIDLKSVAIDKAYIELTQSGGKRYRSFTTHLPIINVDDSNLKKLEAGYGTGDGCIRAIKQFLSADLSNKKFVVFGYGKVGQGIVRYLSDENAAITIIEKDPERLNNVQFPRAETLSLQKIDAVADEMNSPYAVITATGVAGMMSQYFNQNMIKKEVILINMGGDDEYGDQFSVDRVFAKKAPANFSLQWPTRLIFLDPIFAVNNLCCDYVINKGLSGGYHALPTTLDLPYVKAWQDKTGIDCNDVF